MKLAFIVLILLSGLSPAYAAPRGLCAGIVQGWFLKKTIAKNVRPYFDRTTLDEKREIIERFETKAYPRRKFNVPVKTFRDLLNNNLKADGEIIDVSRIDFATFKGKSEVDGFLKQLNYIPPVNNISPSGNVVTRQIKGMAFYVLGVLLAVALTPDSEYNTRLAELIVSILGLNGFTFWNTNLQYDRDLGLQAEIEDLGVFESVYSNDENPDVGNGAVLVSNRFGHSHVLFMLSQDADKEFRLDVVHWAVHFRGD